MRLPWPFRRTSPAGTTAAAGTAAAPRVVQRDEWRGLAPIDETLAPPPLVAPNSKFAAGLAVNNPPPPALGPLGHQRSLDATPGLALGLARPVSRVVDGNLPAPAIQRVGGLRRFIQRSTATVPAGPAWPDDESAQAEIVPPPPTPMPGRPTTGAPRTATAASTTAAPTVTRQAEVARPAPNSEPLPVARRVNAVPPAETIKPRSLTTAPVSVSRQASPGADVAGARVTAPPPPLAASPSPLARAGRGFPFRPNPAPLAALPQAAPPIVSRSTTPGAPRMTLAQSRRAGLGAPIGAKAVAQEAGRDEAAGAGPAGSPSPIPTQRSSTTAPSAPLPAPTAASARPQTSSDVPAAGWSEGSTSPARTSVQRATVAPVTPTTTPPVRTRLGLGEPLHLPGRPGRRGASTDAFAPALAADSAPAAPAAPAASGDSTAAERSVSSRVSHDVVPAVTAPLLGATAQPATMASAISLQTLADTTELAAPPPEMALHRSPVAGASTVKQDDGPAESAPVQRPPTTVARQAAEAAPSPSAAPIPASTDTSPVHARLTPPAPVRGLVSSHALRTSIQREVAALGGSHTSATAGPESVSDLALPVTRSGNADVAPQAQFEGESLAPARLQRAPEAAQIPAAGARFELKVPGSAGRQSVTARPASAPAVGRPVQRVTTPAAPLDMPLAPVRPSSSAIEAAVATAQRSMDLQARAEEPPPQPQNDVAAPVQRAVTIDELSTTPAGSPSGASGASASMPHTPAELEQLATKLWGRLRLQLRRELLTDRERAGLLTDLR